MMHFDRNIDDRPSVFVEKLENIPGSTAGAGSGEYYTYRNRRRDELARENEMRTLEAERKKQEEFEKYKNLEKGYLEKKREKKRARRLKRKANKKQAKMAKMYNKFQSNGNFMEQFLKKKTEIKEEAKTPVEGQEGVPAEQELPVVENNEEEGGKNEEEGSLGKRATPEDEAKGGTTASDSKIGDETVTKKLKID